MTIEANLGFLVESLKALTAKGEVTWTPDTITLANDGNPTEHAAYYATIEDVTFHLFREGGCASLCVAAGKPRFTPAPCSQFSGDVILPLYTMVVDSRVTELLDKALSVVGPASQLELGDRCRPNVNIDAAPAWIVQTICVGAVFLLLALVVLIWALST